MFRKTSLTCGLLAGGVVLASGADAVTTDTFRYDPLGRLTEAVGGSRTTTFGYDAADNLRRVSVSGGEIPPPPNSAATTWNRATSPEWTFANGDLTAIYDGYGASVLATQGLPAEGEGEFSITVHNPHTTQIGLSRLEGNPANTDVGSTADSVGLRQDGRIYGDGFVTYADLGSPPQEGDVITVHLKAGRAWFKRNGGGWNPASGVANPNPATGVGGIPTPVTSSAHPKLYPAAYAGRDQSSSAGPTRYDANFANWLSSSQAPSLSGTWDPAKAAAGWTLTADRSTATYDGYGAAIIGTLGYGSGEHEFSVTIHNPDTTQVGLTRLEANPAGADVGSSPDSLGMRHDGRIYGDGFTVYADFGSLPAEGDVITVRLKDGKAWFRKNGGAWNPGSGVANADPATGVGGITTPALTATHPNLYPMAYAGGDGPGGRPPVIYEANFGSW